MNARLTKLRETIGRKLASLIIGPILAAMLAAVNAMLPESVQWTGEQMAEIVQWIIATVLAFITAQGWVDKTKAANPPAAPTPAEPVAPAVVQPVPEPTNSPFTGTLSQI